MYKVMVIDDEEWIRQGLIKKIEKSGLGIGGVFEAENAMEGMKIIDKEKPDIVICDIRMRGKDGLELSVDLKSTYPDIKIIIITGFDEFDYAKKALQIGVVDFLLKPVNNFNLIESLKRCIDIIEKEQSDQQILKSMAGLERLNTSREKFLKYLYNKEVDLKDIFSYYRKDESIFLSLYLYINTINLESDIMIGNLYQDSGSWECEKNLIFYKNNINEFVIVFCVSGIKDKDSCRSRMADFLSGLEDRIMNLNILQYTFGISNCCGIPEDAIAQAEEAMKFRGLFDDNNRIYYMNVADYKNVYQLQTQQKIAIKNCIRAHQYKELTNILKEISDRIIRSRVSYKSLQGLYTDLIMIGVDMFSTEFENKQNFFPKDVYWFNSLKDMFSFVKELYLNIINTTYTADIDYKKQLIYRVKDYIDLNFDKKITLDSIASMEHVNFCYLSILFKEVMNVNFQDYLLHIRIDNAKALLRTKNFRIKQVAIMTGFTEEHYFSKVFKKLEGITPKDYIKGFVER